MNVVCGLTSHNIEKCETTLNEGCCESGDHEGLTGSCVGGKAGARNLVFFRVKWLQPAMKGTSCVRRVRLRSFQRVIGSSSVFCNGWLFVCA